MEDAPSGSTDLFQLIRPGDNPAGVYRDANVRFHRWLTIITRNLIQLPSPSLNVHLDFTWLPSHPPWMDFHTAFHPVVVASAHPAVTISYQSVSITINVARFD